MAGHLHKYFLNNGGKTLHKWLHYFDIYERHFERFRGCSPTVMEIGVSGGGSLAMWKDYFGPGCRIIGVDVNPECKKLEEEGIDIFIARQEDTLAIDKITEQYLKLDIVIDDGSHLSRDMIKTFRHLYGQISPLGVYLVEDTHACYWHDYDGGLKKPGSFMEFAKDRIDDLNATHTRGALPVSDFTKSTDAICIYDSIVVFEKRPQGQRKDPLTGGM